MDKYHETFISWNKVAKLYEDKFMDFNLYNDTYDKFCEAIKIPNSSVLEIGCGPGNITGYLSRKRPELKLEGIDISANMIELARQNNPGAGFRVMDSRNLHEINQKYNGIICGFLIPYLSETDNAKLIKDCQHLIVGEGVLYLSFVEGDYKKSGFQTGSTGDRVYFYYHHLESIKNELFKNRFELIDVWHKNYLKADQATEVHTVLLAKKLQIKES